MWVATASARRSRVGAFVADAAGAHGVAFYLVLLAIPGAAAAAFIGAATRSREGAPGCAASRRRSR